MRLSHFLLALPLLGFSACDMQYPPTVTPDYTVRVMKSQAGAVAIPPTCESWATQITGPVDNQPFPQFGCAHARNLALMVETPDDLVKGRDMADARGVEMVGSIRRLDQNQTRGLVWTGTDSNQVAVTTSSTATSSVMGDATGANASTAAPTPSAGP